MQLIECASDALVEIAKAAGENLQPFYKDIYQANLRYIVHPFFIRQLYANHFPTLEKFK